jgi:fumarylpyruvate hydrolase
MNTIFAARAPINVPIHGLEAVFPVRRIYCVGRNYAAHAREMGSDPAREPPFFFTKDADAIAANGSIVAYPPATRNYHHEVELVVAIGAEGFDVTPQGAAELIYGYAVGLDMTRRDLQAEARKESRPWSTAKNFPASAPIGDIYPISATGKLSSGAISLQVNGATRQSGDIADMIWKPEETISYLSKLYRLMPGDLIFTGTPDGVGPVMPDDFLHATIEGLGELSITIGEPVA